MSRELGYKLGAIALLIMLLLIPLMMIDGLVSDRQYQRGEVLRDIARSSSFSQNITGPILIVPYVKKTHVWKTITVTGERYMEEQRTDGRLYFLPERLVAQGDIGTEERARGIYKALLYRLDGQISGSFKVPANFGLGDDLSMYEFERAILSVGISDVRGISHDLQLMVNKKALSFAPGSGSSLLEGGVHAVLPRLEPEKEQILEFAFNLNLQGTEKLTLTPVGRDTRVELTSSWPHPSFTGDYLPQSREISDEGFKANWQTSFFATNMEEVLNQCIRRGDCETLSSRSFGVSFIDPVDQYLKTDRAIKYALLFISLTFVMFFLFEVLKRMAVHPVQYALVGMSLAMFYLLLLSLSEHMSFALAYLSASSACVLLIGFYVSFVLRSVLRGGLFAGLLALLYGLLFGLLGAEDYALLMGSVLVFAVLTGLMVLTRKFDWYSVGKGSQPSQALDD